MKKASHENFMTDKEKNYISYTLSRNIRKTEKIKRYSVFFEPLSKNDKLEENHKTEETLLDQLKIDNKSESKIQTIKTKEKNDEMKKKIEERRTKLKEIFKNNLGRPIKKSKKIPRRINVEDRHRLDDNISIKLKIENLYSKAILKKYNLERKKKPLNSEDEDKDKEDLLNLTELITELDFIDFIQYKKFYNLLTFLFDVYNNDIEYKRNLTLHLLKFSTRINHIAEFTEFVNNSFQKLSDVNDEDFHDTDFFENFYFNISNVILSSGLLIEKEHLSEIYYNNICDENLDLIFTLEEDKIIWQFLAVLVRCFDDEKKGVVVNLLKDKIVETIASGDTDKISGLDLFIDAIGIEKMT